ncbi:hypothetical protein DFH09DRAFT_1224364 [Mycena vulgaris]|nr:hypothetical protein DFH09DRAFT_1224364 [Mycena vulgaris]
MRRVCVGKERSISARVFRECSLLIRLVGTVNGDLGFLFARSYFPALRAPLGRFYASPRAIAVIPIVELLRSPLALRVCAWALPIWIRLRRHRLRFILLRECGKCCLIFGGLSILCINSDLLVLDSCANGR